MTTAAVDVNTTIAVPTQLLSTTHWRDGTTSNNNGPLGSEGGKYRALTRPKSKNNPLDAFGWRNPSNYSSVVENGDISFDARRELRSGIPASALYIAERLYGVWTPNWRVPRQTYHWDMVGRAEVKALLALKDQNVNFGVAFAEAGEVAELFTKTAKSMVGFAKSFKRGNPRGWAHAKARQGKRRGQELEKVPNAWLEYQYGVAPLVKDVQGAYASLADKAGIGQPFRCTVKGRLREAIDFKRLVQIAWVSGANPAGWLEQSVTGRHFVNVELTYTLNSPALATASSLGLTNPLEVIWERVPFSFLVDNVLPVGNALSAIDADLGWHFVNGCYTIGYQLSYTGQFRDNPALGSGRWEVGGSCSGRTLDFQRNVYAAAPGSRLPQFKNPFSLKHVANWASLLSQAFR